MKSKLFIGIFIALISIAITISLMVRRDSIEKVREADRFNIPVIEKAMANLSSWNFNDLSPHLSKHFYKLLKNDEELQKDFEEISVLGKVISFSTPRHVSHQVYDHWFFGKCAVNRYSVSTKFENGKGSINFKLNQCNEKVEIVFLQAVSRSLPTRSPALL